MNEETQILLIDKDGKIIRISPTEVRTMGRQAQGVRLIRLDEKQELSSIVAFQDFDSPEELEAKLALAKEQQAATLAMMANRKADDLDEDEEDTESDVNMDEIQEEVELDDLVGDFDDEQDEDQD